MIRKTVVVAATAFSLAGAPALAQETEQPSSKSPAQACKTMPKKKNSAGKGKTLFAVCVSSFKKTAAKNEANEQRQARGQKPVRVIPGQSCKAASKKKEEGQTKSPFAACVKGATEANKNAREAARNPQPAPAS
jgi:hypothetical protein